MKCRWWNRWWHRRLRRLDVHFMLDAICRAAARYGENPQTSPTVKAAWDRFKSEPGQEHWHCDCATEGR